MSVIQCGIGPVSAISMILMMSIIIQFSGVNGHTSYKHPSLYKHKPIRVRLNDFANFSSIIARLKYLENIKVDQVDEDSETSDAAQQNQSPINFDAPDSLIPIVSNHKDKVANMEKFPAEIQLEKLINEISEEAKKEKDANQVDNSFQQAETIKAKLDFEINRTRLVLMRLKSLQRNVADAHSLAKKLVQSEVASKDVKILAINHLDKSIEKVEKIFKKL